MQQFRTLSEKRETEKQRLKELEVLSSDPQSDRTGVLLSQDIIYYSENHHLISPFNPGHLKPAAYELTVGDEWYMGGKFYNICDDASHKHITINPFDVVVIKTAETLCIPRFMIARWNIRVRFAYQGLLWVGGPQVDAGYKGHLFCPLYNLSDKPVRLYVGDEIAVIDFVKTCGFNPQLSKKYPEPSRPLIQDFGIDNFQSALVTKAEMRISQFDDTIKAIEARFNTFITITFAVLAIIVSALALVSVRSGVQDVFSLPSGAWLFVSSIFSLGALFLSMVAVFGGRARQGRNLLCSRAALAIAAIVILGGIAFGYHNLASKIDELRIRVGDAAIPATSAQGESRAKD